MSVALPAAAACALEADDLWFSYGRGVPALKGVRLRAAAGQVTMLVGTSGSGKTTLLKLAKGLLPVQRGTIRLLGSEVPRTAPARLDHRVAYIPQQLGLVRGRSVLENTLTGALWRIGMLRSLTGWYPAYLVARAHERLRSLGIAHKAGERAYALSGGERQRVAIARALMQEPQILLADELTSHLDPVTAREILTIMRGIAREGVTLLIATHQVDLVSEYADRVVVLQDGELVHDGAVGALSPSELTALMRV